MSKAKILYVEDDASLAFVTKDNLEEEGYEVIHCADGAIAWSAFKSQQFDLCLLDVMLPKMDGFELGRKIRGHDPEVPVLFLTAKSMETDRLEGFDLGGDDFIVKPFSMAELLRRIEVFLRRTKKGSGKSHYPLPSGGFESKNLRLELGKEVFELTKREAGILKVFLDNPNQVLTRDEILKSVWGDADYFKGRSLDVYISKLRKYLGNQPKLGIETVHGVGFEFKLEE